MGLICPFLIDLIHNSAFRCVGFAFVFTPDRHPNGSSSSVPSSLFPIYVRRCPNFLIDDMRSAHHQ